MQKTMGVVTSVILAAFAAYAAAFFFGVIEGNFALLLLLATTITGLYWVAEKFYFLPARRKATEQAAQDDPATPGRVGPPGNRPHGPEL